MPQTLTAPPSMFTPPGYATPPGGRPASLGMRLLPNSLRFYLGMLGSVLWARRLAGRGQFGQAGLSMVSEECLRVAERSGARIEITGLEHLDAGKEPAVFIGNHMSTLETFLLPCMICPAKPLGFIVKDSLLRHRLFGPVMRGVPCVGVTRTNARQDLQAVLNQGAEMLKNGYSLCIFPQSTRGREFDESKFNSLGAKLAKRAGVQVIPVAMRTDFWGNGRLVKDVGAVDPAAPVRFAFGPAIPAGTPPQEAQARVVAFVREHLQAWGIPCCAASAAAADAESV